MKVFPRFFPRLLLTAALAVFASSLAAFGQTDAGMRRLTGHVPRVAVAHARLLGRVSSQENISLAFTLPVRNPDGLKELLRRLYTPGDPMQGRFLTPDQFAQQFGPTAADYAAVAAFARSRGLQVTGTHPNRLVLDAAGPASVVESALGVRLQRYQSRLGREFRAPMGEPAIPDALAGKVAGIVGLDNAAVRRPHLRPALSPADGTGKEGGLSPSDIRTAYNLNNVSATGAGQSIALFELDGYTARDIRTYETQYGLPSVPLQTVLVGQADGTIQSMNGAAEVTLDIELSQALAPGLSNIYVYETPNTDANVLDGYSRIATDNLAKQVSTSWGAPELQESQTLLNGENTLFQQMAAQGQSVVSVTGDYGAYDDGFTLSVDDPGSQPYVTGVGGTTLTTDGPGGAYLSETPWGDPTDTSPINPNGSGGGGGFSAVWLVPSYQTSLSPKPSKRSVPDVSLNADPNTGYSVYFNSSWQVFGGTSTAAPLWAGLAALANQQRAAANLGPVGFLNPLIYQIGASADYGNDFHDITIGDNLFYPAGPGYDNATGWGTPIGSGLLHTLVSGLTPTTPGTITGTVTTADTNAPVPNATVTAVASLSGATEATATTGPNGNYTLSVPSGLSLTIFVNAYAATGGQYGGAKGNATVGANQTVPLSFALGPVHTFQSGLQMISAPYAYTSADDLAVLFGTTAPLPAAGPRFAAWVPYQLTYAFYPNSPVNTLYAGLGYWARFPATEYLHYAGPLVPTTTPFQTALSPGWNMIGDPFPAAVPVSSLTAGGASVTSGAVVSPTLFRYDTTAGVYAALNPATDALQPYQGYWIYARQSATLSFPAP